MKFIITLTAPDALKTSMDEEIKRRVPVKLCIIGHRSKLYVSGKLFLNMFVISLRIDGLCVCVTV